MVFAHVEADPLLFDNFVFLDFSFSTGSDSQSIWLTACQSISQSAVVGRSVGRSSVRQSVRHSVHLVVGLLMLVLVPLLLNWSCARSFPFGFFPLFFSNVVVDDGHEVGRHVLSESGL